jgi:anti-anti-sigma regulatory factor
MEGRTITLPVALTAANSKELLRECRRTLYKEPLNLDGSSLMRMDYSGDAFFALLADVSEKTGNKLTLAHFNEEIKAQLRALKKEKIPEKVKHGYSNFLEALGAKTIVIAKEVAEVFILLQRRWEDSKGNLHAARVGTGRQRFGKTVANWVNKHRIPIWYGNITNHAGYHSYMGLIPKDKSYHARNSKGKVVPVIEEKWDDANATPTHILVMLSSGCGTPYTGTPGMTFWIDNVSLVY